MSGILLASTQADRNVYYERYHSLMQEINKNNIEIKMDNHTEFTITSVNTSEENHGQTTNTTSHDTTE